MVPLGPPRHATRVEICVPICETQDPTENEEGAPLVLIVSFTAVDEGGIIVEVDVTTGFLDAALPARPYPPPSAHRLLVAHAELVWATHWTMRWLRNYVLVTPATTPNHEIKVG
jgi:hypothetical protein